MGSHINDVNSILDAIRRIVSVLRVGSRAAERSVGLSGAQLFVLQKLDETPAQSLNELAERTRTHQSSVSVVVRRLVERGLVARSRDRDDARLLRLSLTPKSRAVLRDAPDAVQDRLIGSIERMPANRRKQLGAMLTQMVDQMGAGGASAAMFFEEGKSQLKRQLKRKGKLKSHGRA